MPTTETPPTIDEMLQRIDLLCRMNSTRRNSPCIAATILDGLPALRAAVAGHGAAQPAPGVVEALEAAAKIPEQRARAMREGCQKDNYDPSTGVWECALEARGRDCLCAAAMEEAERIAQDIRALTAKQPDGAMARNDTMCKARRPAAPMSVDCEWPLCDCDPAAVKVIAALEEMGALPTHPKPTPTHTRAEFDAVVDAFAAVIREDAQQDAQAQQPALHRYADHERPRAECYDCRRPYGSFPDMLISNEHWEAINPTRHRGAGLLCPTCIAARLSAAGLRDVPAAFVSDPLVSGVVTSKPGEAIVVEQAQQLAGGAPVGWKLVPVKPPPAMVRAMAEAHEGSSFHDLLGPMTDAYRAMVAASPTPPAAEGWRSKALDDIAAERRRQVEAEGFNSSHDDDHVAGDLARAGAAYVLTAFPRFVDNGVAARVFPWNITWLKPKSRRRDLIRAAALIVAEIERLDRLPTPSSTTAAPQGAHVMLTRSNSTFDEWFAGVAEMVGTSALDADEWRPYYEAGYDRGEAWDALKSGAEPPSAGE